MITEANTCRKYVLPKLYDAWRKLIETANEGYRFQVELIRRWFAQQVE